MTGLDEVEVVLWAGVWGGSEDMALPAAWASPASGAGLGAKRGDLSDYDVGSSEQKTGLTRQGRG